MRRLNSNVKRCGLAVVAVVVLFGLSNMGWAKSVRTRVRASVLSANKVTGRVSAGKISTGKLSGGKVSIAKAQPIPEALAVPGVMPDQLDVVPDIADGVVSNGAAVNGPMVNATVMNAAVVAETPKDGAKDFRLRMDNMHTGEKIDIVYRVGNVYIPDALEKLNAFLRDHHTEDVIDYAPKEFDVLHAMMTRLGRAGSGVIDVVCGYRTPETNEALRHSSVRTGVAEHSQHMEGHAIDLRVPGVSTVALRNAALSLHAGGVGFYPITQFVHIDVGPVRQWVFGPRARRPAAKSRSRASAGM